MFRTLAALFVLVFMTLGMAPAMAQQGAGEADSGVDSAADAPDNPVVAVVDGEATLKRFRKNKNTVVLIPANENMENMKYPAADVKIRGVLVGVVRTTAS